VLHESAARATFVESSVPAARRTDMPAAATGRDSAAREAVDATPRRRWDGASSTVPPDPRVPGETSGPPDARDSLPRDLLEAPSLQPLQAGRGDVDAVRRAVQIVRAVAPATAAAPAMAAAVQVTIGRVEVRAVPGADRAAPRPSRPAPARPSLGDYLRQRNQESR
jgi:hypothetical protein